MTTKAEIDAMKFALAQRANKGVAHMEVGGQARTRAGTIAKPTFIDEQLAKTSERLSKLYNDPDQALRDIARQYFPSSTDTPAQQQQKLEDLALGFAGSIKTPKAPKSPSSTGGDYLPGVHYADPLQAPTMRMSEALGNVGAEGKTLRFTEADRSRVFGPNRGGVGFSTLQHYSIPHKEARTVWGYGNESKARQKINQGSPESTLWTTYAGSPTQHKSNTVVVKDAIKTLQEANKAGTVHPEQINLINYRLQQAVGDNGKPLFPEGFDITDPKALSHATTFDRRAIISDALMGLGVKKPMRSVEFKEANPGVVWSDASNIENILTRETEPILQNANTFDVGPNLFTIENQVIHRPDLNEAFPYQVTGEDLGMRFEPTPFRLAAPEFTKDIPIDEVINAWKMSRGNPSQFVSEEYLTNMQKEGYKDGGVVHMEGGGFLDKLKEELGLQYESLKKPGAVTDIINRGLVAPAMGVAADIPNMALEGVDWLQSKIPNLRKQASVMDTQNPIPQRQDPTMGYVPKFPLATDEPFGGTAQAQRLMREANMTSGTERPLMEAVAGIAAPFSPAAALKAIKAGKAMAPRAGALLERAAAKGQPMPLEMNVMKPKGGNWLAGESERLTKPMKTPKIAGQTPQERIVEHERLLTDPSLNADQLDRVNYHLEVTKGEAALDKWVDKKLNSYIKNEMGTPEDQIRLGIERRAAEAEKLRETNQVRLDKMAADIERNKAAGKDTTLTERDLEAARDKFDEEYEIASEGLYHGTVPVGGWMGGNVWEPQILAYKREKEGFPKGGMGTHPAARQWEFASDAEINSTPAGQFVGDGMPESYYDRTNSLASAHKQKVLDQNPWLSKVDPETKVYKLDEMNPDVGLEFRHMIDEVKTAMDPASNLPKHLKIAAKDLEKMTVDDVSALSGKISAWRNAQKGKPNLELANNPAVSLYKEYPTANNPKGVSWRQIKRPEGLPDEEADKALRDAIGYEGDIMRHCVGGSGHCEPLLRGETEVYSLRDAKGEPHVTIEVKQGKPWNERSGVFYDNPELESSWQQFSKEQSLEAKTQGSSRPRDYIIDYPAWLKNNEPELYNKYQDVFKPDAPAIVEIKGKNNRKPKDEYIPFIQDFIRSGNWGNVGDMHHTDLRKLSTGKYATDQELKSLLSRHYPDNPNMTPTNAVEHYDLMKKHPEYQDEAAKKFIQDLESGNYFAPPEGMKRGGAVRMAAGGSPDPYQDDEDMSLDEKKFALLKAKQKKAVIKPMAASPDSINELRASLGLPDQEIEYKDAGLGGALQLNTYSQARSKEMFPKQYGIDDQRDAARHMIAAGTLARKFNPSVARFVGKGYEFLSSPATSIGYGLGLNEMPPDYAMDIYNNELGIELARKAKTQEEFERLVNMSATGALPEKSPGRAMIIPTKKK